MVDGQYRRNFWTMKGIFELNKHPTDASKDKVRWCFAMPKQPRPTNFLVESESNHKLVELERFVPDEHEAAEKFRAASADVKQNRKHKWIETLTLKDSDAPDSPLDQIRKLRKLKTLNLDAANSKIVRSLSENIALMSLNFDCEITPSVLQELSVEVPRLRTIAFRCTNFTPEHGKAISQFESLASITISNNESSLDGIEKLAGRKTTGLQFRDCKLNHESLSKVAMHMPDLRRLEIHECEISDSDLKPIAKLQKTGSLVLENCDISDEGIRNLSSLPELRYLTINGTSVTNASLEVILKNFPELFILTAKNVNFDEGIIPTLAKVEKQLVVRVSQSSVSREQAKAAGEKIAKILR